MSDDSPGKLQFRIVRISQAEFRQYWSDEPYWRDQQTEWFRDEARRIIGRLQYDPCDGPSSNIGWCCVMWWKDESGRFTNECKDLHGNISRQAASDLLLRAMASAHRLLLSGQPVKPIIAGIATGPMWKTDLDVADVDVSVIDLSVAAASERRWWEFWKRD